MCLRTIAPKILTWGQYAEAAVNLFQKTVMGRDLPEYVPDFTKCMNHFALHAGAQAARQFVSLQDSCLHGQLAAEQPLSDSSSQGMPDGMLLLHDLTNSRTGSAACIATWEWRSPFQHINVSAAPAHGMYSAVPVVVMHAMQSLHSAVFFVLQAAMLC